MKLMNYVFAIAIIILGIYVTITSYMMSGSAALFPKITGIALLISSVLLLITIIIEKEAVFQTKIEQTKVFRFIYTIILMILYTIVIKFIGAFISTVILFIGMSIILTEDVKQLKLKNYINLTLIALIIVGVIYSMFKFILNVPLPEIF